MFRIDARGQVRKAVREQLAGRGDDFITGHETEPPNLESLNLSVILSFNLNLRVFLSSLPSWNGYSSEVQRVREKRSKPL
jgi:hypothetical protein